MDEDRDRADPRPSADELPWPLSALDTSPAATRRRGLRFFHVVLLLLAGGSGLAVVGVWILVPLVVGVVVYVSLIQRGSYPDLVAGVDRMGTQLTALYASIQQANEAAEVTEHATGATVADPRTADHPPPTSEPDPRAENLGVHD